MIYLDHFCHILALLYRRTSKNVYGDDIIEPYEYSPRDRLDWYLDYPITDGIAGIFPLAASANKVALPFVN